MFIFIAAIIKCDKIKKKIWNFYVEGASAKKKRHKSDEGVEKTHNRVTDTFYYCVL